MIQMQLWASFSDDGAHAWNKGMQPRGPQHSDCPAQVAASRSIEALQTLSHTLQSDGLKPRRSVPINWHSVDYHTVQLQQPLCFDKTLTLRMQSQPAMSSLNSGSRARRHVAASACSIGDSQLPQEVC